MSKNFGEKVQGYQVKVFNEREVRAAAGILFLFAIISFLNAFLIGNFNPIKVFVIAFFIDFFIRMFINPKYSPSLILGRIAVHKQKPEYSGAPQKRFAWAIGLILSAIMFYIVVIQDIRGPLNLGICLLCLTFLFFEAVFGICIGCKTYNLFNKEKAQLCPGGACEIRRKEKIQEITLTQIIITIIFIALIIFIAVSYFPLDPTSITTNTQSTQTEKNPDCEAPQWAIDIGHEEMWKLHNGCT
jgi:hypothetical protein